jgi:hypothetical protein
LKSLEALAGAKVTFDALAAAIASASDRQKKIGQP